MRIPLSMVEDDPVRARGWLMSWARHCLITESMSRMEYEEHPHTVEVRDLSGVTEREVEAIGEMVASERDERSKKASRETLW